MLMPDRWIRVASMVSSSKYPKDKGPPREYFFNILNTLYPDYLQQIMAHASKQRMSAEGEDNKK